MQTLRHRIRRAVAEFVRPMADASVRRFDGAAGGRRGTGIGTFGPINSEIGAAGQTLAARSAYLAENNPFVANGVRNLTGVLIGPGIRPNPRHPSPEVRKLLAGRFDAWNESADMDGRTSFDGLQASIARELVIKGEAFVLMIHTDAGLRLRLISPEQVARDQTRALEGGSGLWQGIEFDAHGRRVAYHVYPTRDDQFGQWSAPVRIDAADVLHIMKPSAPGQVRGIPWTAPVILQASEFDKLCDALLMSASVAAMLVGVVTDENALGDGSDAFGNHPQPSLEPGTMVRLRGGQKVTFSSPQQLSEAGAFVKLNLHSLAAGLGVPTHLLDNDLTGANYSSLRAGLLPFRQHVEQVQYGVLVPQLLRPVWDRFVTTEVLSGTITADDFETARAEYGADWIMPRPMQVDPLKDTQATVAEMSAGLTSRRKAIAERGWSAEELDEEIASDREREASLGLGFSASTQNEKETEAANDAA